MKVESNYDQAIQIKSQFFVLCSPDEILKQLLDDKTRRQWDENLRSATVNTQINNLTLVYENQDLSPFTEVITFKYMVHQNKFYIIEDIESIEQSKTYQRVWVLEQVQNRPYFMRVTVYAEAPVSFLKGRFGGEALVRSLSGLRNYVQ